jgi:hypothetical protein
VSQESIYKPQVKPDGTTVQFTYTMLMLFFQSVTGVLFALGTHTIIRTFNPSYGARMVNGVATKESELSLHLISRPGFSLCAAYYLLAMAFSNEALRFVSYPFQCAWLHASLGMCGAACMFACVCVCVCVRMCVCVCVCMCHVLLAMSVPLLTTCDCGCVSLCLQRWQSRASSSPVRSYSRCLLPAAA